MMPVVGIVPPARKSKVSPFFCWTHSARTLEPGSGYWRLTVEFKVNLLSPARGDFFIAEAKVVRAGKTLIVARSEVFAELEAEQKLIAAIQATIMCIHNPNGLEN